MIFVKWLTFLLHESKQYGLILTILVQIHTYHHNIRGPTEDGQWEYQSNLTV